MRNFTTENVEDIKGREVVEQLVINGKKAMDLFKEELEGTTYIKEFNRLPALVEHIANGGNFGKVCKVVKGYTRGVIEYEFITPNLRLFAIQEQNKKIIIFGGKKQKADSSDNIEKFRLLKHAYMDSLNLKK